MSLLHLPALALALAAATPAAETPARSVELSFKPYLDWDFLLPREQFATIAEGITYPHANGDVLAARLEGTVLWLDRDGDGECDAKVEPLEPGETALMVFRPRDASGEECTYAVRLRSDGQWSYSASGAMVGELGGTRIALIDQNNNGRFGDFGEDAMVVGRGKAAGFLSRVIEVDGELYSIEVTGDGRHVEAWPFEYETGVLDLSSELESKARMRAVVVKSTDGELSFEVSQAREGLKVPAGKYRIHSGAVALGKGRALLGPGRSEPITVTAGETTTLEWGGPLEAEFRYARRGGELQIAPENIRYFGRAGEEYGAFLPLGCSPLFTIKDADSGEVLVTTRFPGST